MIDFGKKDEPNKPAPVPSAPSSVGGAVNEPTLDPKPSAAPRPEPMGTDGPAVPPIEKEPTHHQLMEILTRIEAALKRIEAKLGV